jgi:uncharacterized protein HemY
MLTSQNPDPNARRTFVLFRPFVAVWKWLFPPTQAHQDRQSSSSRILAAAIVVTILVGIVVFTAANARKWYNLYQTWQANRKIAAAVEMEKQDHFLEAWNLANEAYILDPDNPTVIRTLARYYIGRGQNQADYMLKKLRKLGVPETDDDRLLRIQALANNNDIKDAQVQIEQVLRDSPPSARIVEIADQVLRQRGRTKQLLDILRSYVALKPEDWDIRLKLGTREVEYGSAGEIADGMKVLWELAERPEEAGLGALKFLDEQEIKSVDEERRLISLLQKHPLGGEEEHIAALRRLVKLEPARKVEIVEKAIADRKQAKREDLVPLARWLNQEGEHERLLGFLKKDMAQDYAPLLGQYLNALTLAIRFEELKTLVEDPRTRLTVSERAFYQAHLAFVTKKSWDEVNMLLVEALAASQSDVRPQSFISIAQWAEQRGHPKVAEQAYRAAAENTASDQIQRLGYEGLLKLTYRNGDSAAFLQAAQKTARRWPENQHFMERSLYATLLSGIEIEMAVPRVQKLLDAKPDDGQRKLLMALALYRMMDPKAALQYIEHLNLSELSPGQGAVLCGILYRAGDTTVPEARRVAEQISRDAPMLPEERKFLEKVRPDLASALGALQPGQP